MLNQNFSHNNVENVLLGPKDQELIAKIRLNKLSVISEKRTIKQAEDLLTHFKQCLKEQSDDLIVMIKEGDRLEEELSICMGYKYSGGLLDDNHIEEDKGPFKSSLKRKHSDFSEEVCSEADETCSKKCNGSESVDRKEVDEDTSHSNDTSKMNVDISYNRMELSQIKDVTIYSMFQKSDLGLFMGGSNGFLMRYLDGKAHIYDTDVSDSIMQVEIMMVTKAPFLIALTKTKILVFSNLMHFKPVKQIRMSEIVAAFNEGNILFITLASGQIKKLNKTNWIVCDYQYNDTSKILYVTTVNNPYKLLTLKDNLLYKTRNKDLSNIQKVRGVENVKRILTVKVTTVICTSDFILWVLGRECDILGTVKFQDKIKMIFHDNNMLVVVDCKDVVHLYGFRSSGKLDDKILSKHIEGGITAVNVFHRTVYIAVKDAIVNIRCRFNDT